MLSDNRIAALTAENDELRERIRQLEDALCPAISIPAEWALSPTQERMFRALVAREFVSYDALAFCAPADVVADRRTIHVQMLRLRRATRRDGVIIRNVIDRGYRLEDRKRWARAA